MKPAKKTGPVVAVGAGLLGVLMLAGTLGAHDFWLVPVDLRIAPGEVLQVQGQTSSQFPTSEAAVAPERVADARVIAADGESRITDLSQAGTSLLLRDRPRTPGQRVVAVSLMWRSVRESAQGFRRYLELEGAADALARLEREGRLPGDSITRRYAKYAKTVVEVGEGGSRAYATAAGHPLEFIPLVDPAGLRVGDTLAVRLIYAGQPLSDAHVHAGAAPAADSAAADVSVTTDAHGILRVVVGRAGLWNVRTIHVVPSPAGSGADWDTHWASLVVGVGGSAGTLPPLTPGADSTSVAAAVDRFHAALAAGDSAGVLALLAPDVVILESGGIESRQEYRSHHLPGDIAFAQAPLERDRGPVHVRLQGDVAWATSTSSTRGTFRDRQIDSQGAELMVLRRTVQGWQIVAVHWSSRQRRR